MTLSLYPNYSICMPGWALRFRAAREGCWPPRPQRGTRQALLDRAVSCVRAPEAAFVLEESLPVPMAGPPEGETVTPF